MIPNVSFCLYISWWTSRFVSGLRLALEALPRSSLALEHPTAQRSYGRDRGSSGALTPSRYPDGSTAFHRNLSTVFEGTFEIAAPESPRTIYTIPKPCLSKSLLWRTKQSGTLVPGPTGKAARPANGTIPLPEALEIVGTDDFLCSRKTGKKSGVIHKYGLNLGRQEFREKAADIGFVKVGIRHYWHQEVICG